jgi:hypothetical protein
MKPGLGLWIAGLLTATAFAQDDHKATAGNKPVPATISPEIQKLLGKESVTVTSGNKEMLHLWLRTSIPTTATGGAIAFAAIREGTLLGTVEILKGVETTDFRNQKLDPGIYTLRLGSHPQDGNHMGISPFPEYLCLCPAAEDKTADPIDHDALMELSEKSVGTGHPAVLYLEPATGKEKGPFPMVRTNAQHHVVLQVKTQAVLKDKKPAELLLGIIVVGVSDAA